MPPIVEIRAWVELALIIFLAAKAVGSMVQRQESGETLRERDMSNLRELISQNIKSIESRLERMNSELSRWASFMQGIETRMRKDYIEVTACKDHREHISENLKNCQERHSFLIDSKG